jgi:hypothetical protein
LGGGAGWRTAFRIASTSLLDSGKTDFVVLPDDGQRYYADPFPVRTSDGDFIFVEELRYGTGRGSIAVTKIINNRADRPVTVIEEPYHLSYPFVFEDAGEFWMIPESGASGGIDLYRAEKFPYRWKREARLLDRVNGYDATLLAADQRLWLFVCEKLWNSSTYDVLSLFSAECLTGPWRPHPDNPLLIDAAQSRGGGAIFARNGRILRPVQDCSRVYGGGLSFYSIDTIDESRFVQTVRGRLYAPGALRCHTYNNFRGLEVVDVYARESNAVTVSYREEQ